jgi:hypothetical protein
LKKKKKKNVIQSNNRLGTIFIHYQQICGGNCVIGKIGKVKKAAFKE